MRGQKQMKKNLIYIIVILVVLPEMIFTAIADESINESSFGIEGYDMVIITSDIFSESANRLIDHKSTVGISAFLKTNEEIYTEYPGHDTSEQIRYFIKDAIEEYGIRFVLLLGDIDHIPMRQTAVTWDYFGNVVVPNVITDLYYADIYDQDGSLSNWDSNGNGVYSQINMIMNNDPFNETLEIIDELEGVPDISVGRIPCSNKDEAKNIIEKIIVYETTAYGSEWSERLILLGGDTFPNVGGINEGEYVTDYISTILTDFIPIKLWASLGTFKPMNINKEISKGAGFVSYSGHGFEYGFGTSQPDASSMITYYLPYILGIRNTDKCPIMYFDACLTASLDYNLFNVDIPCFAWSMLKKPESGAVACIGSTRVGFGGFSGDPFIAGASSLHRYFFDSYQPGVHLGDMFVNAQKEFIENISNKVLYDPLTLQEFTLLGDPSLKIGGYP